MENIKYILNKHQINKLDTFKVQWKSIIEKSRRYIMGLQLVLGGSGNGKTTYVTEHIIKESLKEENRNKNYILMVPEQYTMQTQKDIVQMHPNKGIMNIDVLSFGRLAYRIFGELGAPSELLIDDETKNLILKKIAKEQVHNLKLLGENVDKLGYISEVKSLISEFEQYDVGTQEMEDIIDDTPENTLLSYKLQDINLLYSEFQKFKDKKYITNEEQLDRVSELVAKSEILKDSVIVLDGFTGFTPVQYRLIIALLDVCQELLVTVTIDQDNARGSYVDNFELFATSKETIYKLKKIAKDNYITVNEDIFLATKSKSRHALNDELAFLGENIFRYKNKQYKDQVDSIEISVSKSVKDEARWVASTIRRMVREENYRYKDFAIIASQPDTYMGHLRRQCEAMEVPLFADNKRSILLNSFVEYVRSLLEMREKNYSYETTFRFLKSGLGYSMQYINADGELVQGRAGYGNIQPNAIDTLENYVLKKGIRGYKQWSRPWCDTTQQDLKKSDLYIENNRLKFIEQIQDFHNALGKKNKTVEDIATALYHFLELNNIQQKVENRAAYFAQDNKFALEKEYLQIYGAFMELLDKLVSVLREGDQSIRISTREFIELLDAGFEEMRIGVIPPSIDTVIAGDLQRTRLSNVKVLFLVGANDTLLPGNLSVSGILSEVERERFSEKGINLKPTANELMYLHKFYMYLNLTKPTDKIFISYPGIGSNGKTTRGAYIINDLQHLYPKLAVKQVSLDINNGEFTQSNGLEYLVQGFKQKEVMYNPSWIDLNKWYGEQDEWVEVVDLIKEAHLYSGVKDSLSPEIAKELYGDTLNSSVSRIEKYATCPFKYFLESGLKLRERELRECKANDIGNVIHSALEMYGNYINESNQSWATITVEEQERLSDEFIEASVKDYGDQLFQENARDEYTIQRMKRLMRRSVWALTNQLGAGEFEPDSYEMKFGETEATSPLNTIKLEDGTTMNLRGTIDRLDTYKQDDKLFVKIVDYKTGSSDLDLSALVEGQQLQLFVYLDAALKEVESKNTDIENIVPAGVFYYKVNDPIVKGSIPQAARMDEIQKELKVDGLVTEQSWRKMDGEATGSSTFIPIKVNKDGSLAANQLKLGEKELLELRKIAMDKVCEFGNGITSGNIAISPCLSEKTNACSYCNYNNICGFDPSIGEYKYRKIQKKSNADVLNEIKNNIEGKEENDGN